ncbi:aldo-keto reductase family 1 member D1-like [Glandiceps talaboti]
MATSSSAALNTGTSMKGGVVVIPKSVTPCRIKENIEVFDFKLSADEIAKLDTLNKNFRLIRFDLMNKHPHYPFELTT